MANPSIPITADIYSDSVLRFAQANAIFLIGWAEAASQGYKTFLDSLDAKNVARLDFNNGLIQGAVNGWSKSMEMMPKIVERSFEALAGKSAGHKAKSKTSSKPAPHKGR
jgi:hypothetical protein